MLYFELQNIRVFNEHTLFQTTPKKIQTKFKDLYLQKHYADKTIDVLPFSVIHGANASGKSTIIKAMALLKDIVLGGKIYSDNPSTILYNIALYPYLHDYNCYKEPLKLAIGFIANGNKFDYSITMQFSLPDNMHPDRRHIVEEILCINNIEVFRRTDIDILINNEIRKAIGKDEAVQPDELYLHSGFKTDINTNKYYQAIINWFRVDFYIIFDINTLRINIEGPALPYGSSIKIKNAVIDAALKTADFGPQLLFYRVSNNDSGIAGMQLRSQYNIENSGGHAIETNAIDTESNGTIKLVEIAILIVNAILRGSTIVFDELDSSFHIALIKEILNLFTNKDVNKLGAQLIFSSHNLSFMSLTRIRKDQIYFVEKNSNSYKSTLYSLSDFKTNAETDVRNGEQYIKNYLEGKYGAFPTFNLEDAIVDYLNRIEAEKNQ